MSPAPARAPRQAAPGFGAALRGWRRHRGLSQLDLALAAEVSPRHVSFLETGRSRPSQEMVLRRLDAPAPPPALAAVVDELRAFPGVERLLGGARAPLRAAPFVPIETPARARPPCAG